MGVYVEGEQNDSPLFFYTGGLRLRKGKVDAGLSALLESAGFSSTDVRRYLDLSTRPGTETARIQILRGQRGRLMDELHRRQQVLDQVDFLIWQAERGNF